jgi:predicted RNA-binding protein with PIN domain
MRDLVAELEDYAQSTGEQVMVVFDSKPLGPSPGESVDVVFATAKGPNAADDEIVRILEQEENRSALRVVTSDAGLAGRVRAHGVEVESTRPFRRRLDAKLRGRDSD